MQTMMRPGPQTGLYLGGCSAFLLSVVEVGESAVAERYAAFAGL